MASNDDQKLPFPVSEVRSPAFLVDLNQYKRNTSAMQARAKRHGLTFRPHVKTHKTIEGARIQTSEFADARKIVVSTLAEARFFAEHGFRDMVYSVPLDTRKLGEITALREQGVAMHIFVDCRAQLEIIEQHHNEHGSTFSCFLKIDTGYHRAGVVPDDDAFELAQSVAKSDAIELVGLYAHAGHTYDAAGDKAEIQRVADEERIAIAGFADRLRAAGIDPGTIGVGSTPACSVSDKWDGVTEIHPGNYAFYDRQQSRIGSCTEDDIACSVLTRVISHYPKRNELLVDAGALSLSKDTCPDGEWGSIVGHPELKLKKISQDEGVVAGRDSSVPLPYDALPLGTVLRVLPNHSCLTAACFTEYHVCDGDQVVAIWRPCRGW